MLAAGENKKTDLVPWVPLQGYSEFYKEKVLRNNSFFTVEGVDWLFLVLPPFDRD